MGKKIFKWVAIVLGVLLIALLTTPFLFKDKMKDLVVKTINNNLDATVNFNDVSISLFKNFPKATVGVDKLSVINKAPFEGDTLVYAETIQLKMSLSELFKSEGEAINVESLLLENSLINIVFNKDGIGNFDIALKDEEEKTEEEKEAAPFALSLNKYEVKNLKFVYHDQASNMKAVLDEINHIGKGDMSAMVLDLDTDTKALVSFDMGEMNLLNKVPVSLDAILGLDLENSKYTFKENMALINKLPLEFDGYLQLKEEGQEMNISFNTPTTSFSNFLKLIPSAYSGSFDNIKTTGDFSIDGVVNGLMSETTIPKFNIKIASDNASFKFPDLPKSIDDIVIDTKIVNETGLVNDTYVNLDKLSFRIDKDVFSGKANVLLQENILVDAVANGTINLSNISKAYPISLDMPLEGILKANVKTNFDMASVENGAYENIKNSGEMSLSGFKYSGDIMAKPVEIKNASLQFNPNHVALKQFEAKTGGSDMQLTGTLDNFYGFLFKNQTLKGNFNLSSNQLVVNDFMSTSTAQAPKNEESTQDKKSTETEALKIPSFLDCTITAKANTVVYDNLNLKDVFGKMVIKDEAVDLQNLKTSIFGGQIVFDGKVSTKEATPNFKMNLGLNAVDIFQTFTQLDMLKKIAPIAGIIDGKMNSKIALSGNLNAKEMTPDLNSLTGDLLGQLSNTKVNVEKSTLLNSLNSNFNFIDAEKLSLNNIQTHLSFKDGKVNLKPIELKYQDIKINFSGEHGFDQNMNYAVNFDVPAKYLGKEVSNLLAQLNNNQAANNVIPVKANITGNFSKPNISTDMKSAVTTLTNQLIEQQKAQLIDKGKNEVTKALGNIINKNASDSTKTVIPTTKEEVKQEVKKQAEEKVKQGLKNLLGGSKK